MSKRSFLIGYKLIFSLLAFSAIITEIATIAERGRFVPINFFGYFTVESNLFAAAVLLLSALAVAQNSSATHRRLSLLRGAATVYMATTGIVFALLLSGLNVELTAVPWDNIVLHYLMPLALVADWLIQRPAFEIQLRQAVPWLIFPVVYVVYSLIRGWFAGWYPYPFLDPATNGYAGVAVTSLGIALLEVALIWLAIQFGPAKTRTRR
ncbi:MAG TPA: Pr6Pr family membrane protein [Candidatus Saccharimonadia bacterium]|nr:Pr6Pr family membrane protein [Candidatus Saccharimonadia bacterium]